MELRRESMGRLDKKVALIAGGASGFGSLCASQILCEGAIVIVGDDSHAADAEPIVLPNRGLQNIHLDVTLGKS
jgi:NAD(P)-dependent dehydrogenase (short-subunit alcohol dehydrogenase family)